MPAQGRALVKRVPEPVQHELKKLSSGGVSLSREIFAGLLVGGLIAIVAGYARLSHGPVFLPNLVPAIEASINGELTDLHVDIDNAVLMRSPDGPGIVFRLKNIRLIDREDSVVAQAPFAAVGLSGSALLTGRIAVGSVDFIGPRLLLFYSDEQGLALTFSEAEEKDGLGGDASQASPFGPLTRDPAAPAIATQPSQEAALAESGAKLNVTQMVGHVLDEARTGDNSYLTRFGVKDAEVVLSHNGRQTFVQVPEFSANLDHRSGRSILIGALTVGAPDAQWHFDFKVAQRPRQNSMALTVNVEDLKPSAFSGNLPEAEGLAGIDIPITGEANVELADSGEFLAWSADFNVGHGLITVPWEKEHPMEVDEGELHVRYQKDQRIVRLLPSSLSWGRSKIAISGAFTPQKPQAGQPDRWDFRLDGDKAFLAADEFGIPPVNVDTLLATGVVTPEQGRIDISKFLAKLGEASVQLTGSFIHAPKSPEMHIQGTISPMPADIFKQIWPKFIAPGAKEWAGKNVLAGRVVGGKVDINMGPGELDAVKNQGADYAGTVSFDMDAADLRINYIDGLPPVSLPTASVHMRGTTFYADVPKGTITLPSGDQIALNQGRYEVADLRPKPHLGVLTFSGRAGTSAVLQLLDHPPLHLISDLGRDPTSFGGIMTGDFAVSIPAKPDLTFDDIGLNGSAQIENVVANDVVGDLDIKGGTYDVSLTEQSVEVSGEVAFEGVPAQVTWQRLFKLPEESQPPVRLTANLDAAERDKLGMKVNHLVKGVLPVTLLFPNGDGGGDEAMQNMQFEADLTNTELTVSSMGWIKPAGQRAVAKFKVNQAKDGSARLENFAITGENEIDIQGWVALDKNKQLQSFHFPDFSFNSLTHVEITGETGADGILKVKANGPTYDGKQFFKSLFSAGQLAADAPAESDESAGMDMTAHFGTVIGNYGTTLQNVDVDLKTRKGDLVALDAKGNLNGKSPVGVRLENEGGSRVIRAESRNAGDAFRLVGFYRQVQGGEGTLLVNLDAGSNDMKRGTLWVRNFEVVSDDVVSNLLTDQQSQAAFGPNNRQRLRNRLRFDRLRAPFAVGNNQFLLQDAYMNGPILGATMRGSVNFKAQTVDLGGTYVPLYGLNSALGQIPILGNILVGRQGEGIVGITFAIKGKLQDPAVLVNPMSVVAPGIFRQIFEFNGQPPNGSATRSGSIR
ncbi:AsmA-like C-terminal domain-containing protein [Methyloligella sp. 2.7D]|uniref:YhdP family protein n=1 Tax=unclassified Methyloligella TaxID=2625955 RepID=UPI00157DF1FB|nr:AsmA-like C-terminal domain-containing protein [Methyloligella sp. GL2]QKP77806.1 AsmA-like C-terminal domain-containing protein [Methyloligella sp. GL2]